MKIPVNKVVPNPNQPRTVFDEDELAGLAQSIREVGLIQPINVEAAGDGYILIDGERRWRAHQLAGLDEIEAVVKEGKRLRGKERLTQALVANIQRSAMGFVDEAMAYRQLMDEYGGLEAVVVEQDGKFDALALLAATGYKKPLSAAVRQAARATCKACALYGEASMVTCRECPLPEFLKRLEGEVR